ncbi:MAG: endonuclease/exonuclease/phosphatase family protein [Bacteroidota bacterium]|nr:endonuclease/exonuclease/phosphatase family protein [Bacteroidota bacterium]
MLRRADTLLIVAATAAAFFLFSCSAIKETAVKTAPPKPAVSTFKIMSLNTDHALQSRNDVKRFVQWMKKIAPDVIALQQIDVPLEGKEGFDEPAEVAKQAEMYQLFGMARYWYGKNSGNAVLSTYPIASPRVEALPAGKAKVRRSLVYGVVDLGVRSVAFASTELDDQSPSERERQVKAILHVAQRDSEFPLVVCGIFNESASGQAASTMMKQFSLVNLLDGALGKTEQQIYSVPDSVLKPVSVERISYSGTHTDAVVATFEILK